MAMFETKVVILVRVLFKQVYLDLLLSWCIVFS